MEKELSVSFNVQLSAEIIRELKAVQHKLAESFTEKRFYDSSPHLSIANKFMTDFIFPNFAKAIKNEFKDETRWELEFADFKLAETNDYVFLHLSPESRQKMFDIHEQAFRATKDIGSETPNGKFRHFPYDPHISIIKIEPEQAMKALSEIQKNMSGVQMPVTKYEITKQIDDENGFANFPIICEIDLK